MSAEPPPRRTTALPPAADRTWREQPGDYDQGPAASAEADEKAMKWRTFDQTVAEAHAALADLSPDDFARLLDEAIPIAREANAR